MSRPGGSQPGAWQPVLDGADADAARALVREIADALAAAPIGDDASLAGGSAGRALLHARLADTDPTQRDAALACARHAAAALGSLRPAASLLDGAAGVGWMLEHLRGTVLEDRDRCASLDRALLRLLDRRDWDGRFDLVAGLVGIGVYALERFHRAPAASDGALLLERVVERLAATAVRDTAGVHWFTSPARLPPEMRERCPQGQINLGLAHGAPGPIGLLGAACSVGVGEDTARTLLPGAVAFLLAQRDDAAAFPYWIAPDQEPVPARTAWCYGAPGIAAALLLAARGMEEPAWERAAIDLARAVVSQPVEEAGVTDAGLCHGAAGLGMVFARLSHATGDTELGEAAQRWFRQVLGMRDPARGVAGFVAVDAGGERADAGLLTGAAGIALALDAAAGTGEPAWDRMLLLSTVRG